MSARLGFELSSGSRVSGLVQDLVIRTHTCRQRRTSATSREHVV
jgi:hypothetical protein